MEQNRIVEPTFAWWDLALFSLVAAAVVLATFVGMVVNLVTSGLLIYSPIAISIFVWRAWKKQLVLDFVKRLSVSEHRWLLVQLVIRVAFLITWCAVLKLSLIPMQLVDSQSEIGAIILIPMIIIGVLPLIPSRRVFIARNVLIGVVTLFLGTMAVMAIRPEKEVTLTLDSPFRADALVFQGGTSPLLNHHFSFDSQRHAVDLMVPRNGRLFEGPEKELASHGCFNEPVLAPVGGTIARVVTDQPDQPIGKADRHSPVGNHVVIQIDAERYVLLAHLKRDSVSVREGDHIASGQPVAACGNSGNTSAPHLHVQVQNRVDFNAPDLRTFPFVFQNTERMARRNDVVANTNH